MARFAIDIALSYSRNQDASAARNALGDALTAHPEVTGQVGGSAGTATFTGEAPDRTVAEAFQADAVAAWGRGTRTEGHSTITRLSDLP